MKKPSGVKLVAVMLSVVLGVAGLASAGSASDFGIMKVKPQGSARDFGSM